MFEKHTLARGALVGERNDERGAQEGRMKRRRTGELGGIVGNDDEGAIEKGRDREDGLRQEGKIRV